MLTRETEMTDAGPDLTVLLCSDNPRSPFSEDLIDAWSKGRYTDAAVAFLTKGGVDFFINKCLDHQDYTRCRLCFTVQWPTDLDSVARLSPILGPNLRIHLGAKTPFESGTDLTPMMHSKVIITDYGNDKCTAFVGSHNWTSNALNGVNCEASVRVDCGSGSSFAIDLRKHLDECAAHCVPFDLNDLAYYKAVQRALSAARPPGPEAEDVSAFSAISGSPAVIIHSEGEEESFRMEKMMLFLPIKSQKTAKWFSTTTPTTVFLFLYPPESLIGQSPPKIRPILFEGRVGTNNDVTVSPSTRTNVTCQVRNFEYPVLELVADGNIPPIEDEQYQVVAELHRTGPTEVPIYHRGKRPLLMIAARFDEPQLDEIELPTDKTRISGDDVWHMDATEDDTDGFLGEYDADSVCDGIFLFKEPTPDKVLHLDVPERWLYSLDVEEAVRNQLPPTLSQRNLRINFEPAKKKVAYVYRVQFVLQH